MALVFTCPAFPGIFLLTAITRFFYSGSAAYTCEGGETIGEVMGEPGNICAPRCDPSYQCTGDFPQGVIAKPQCILKDVSDGYYCTLVCSFDTECPSGDACKQVKTGTQEVGMCVHPVSFKDWASGQSSRTKLAISFPTREMARVTNKGFEVAKAYASLQSLKRRYGISDGDADALILKETLAELSAVGSMRQNPVSAANLFGPSATQFGTPVVNNVQAPQMQVSNSNPRDFSPAAFEHDIDYVAKRWEQGLPGIEREIHDTVWNIEHINEHGKATQMLRDIILIAAVYLGIGSAYKYQMLNARGVDVIPHVLFWTEFPHLVRDGVKYSMQLLGLGHLTGSDDFSAARVPGAVVGKRERDTYSNFEPML